MVGCLLDFLCHSSLDLVCLSESKHALGGVMLHDPSRQACLLALTTVREEVGDLLQATSASASMGGVLRPATHLEDAYLGVLVIVAEVTHRHEMLGHPQTIFLLVSMRGLTIGVDMLLEICLLGLRQERGILNGHEEL